MNVSGALPQHIAIIMDGNGRWAEKRNRPRTLGHRAGVKAVQVCVEFCINRNIRALTLFAFSSENWKRPEEEVGALMKLFLHLLDNEIEEMHRRGIRIQFIGAREDFSADIQQRMLRAESLTAQNTQLLLNIAASYGGRWDITQAARKLAQRCANGELRSDDINEELLSRELCLNNHPAPDLFIRTGGDFRISNFLLWQLAYTELWFTQTLWPDLDETVLEQAVMDYRQRERRFGLTSAQIQQGSPS
jgi:undecaprenyl diphosphate synthase